MVQTKRIYHLTEQCFQGSNIVIHDAEQEAEHEKKISFLSAAVKHWLVTNAARLDMDVRPAHVDFEQRFACLVCPGMQQGNDSRGFLLRT